MESIWLLLDHAGIVVGLILAIPVIWTWWQIVFGERRQRRRWIAEIRRITGERPGVLILDLLPGRDIHASVHAHLSKNPTLSKLPEQRVISVRRDTPLQPEHLVDLARDIRAALRKMQDAGVDVIHLYHAGPDVSALIAGAELANGPRVLIQHYDQGAYRVFGPLEPLR